MSDEGALVENAEPLDVRNVEDVVLDDVIVGKLLMKISNTNQKIPVFCIFQFFENQ